MIRDILAWFDAWYAWWMDFWYNHPVLFAVMVVASVAFSLWVRGRKP